MQLSPFPCHLIPLRSKYFPQHPILKHPQPVFLPQCQRPGFTPIQNHGQNYSSIYLSLLLHILGKNPTLQHYSYTFRFSNNTPIICFPPSRMHCSSLSRDFLIASLTMLSGVAVISPFIPFLSLSMSLRFASYTLDLGYPQRK